MPYATDLMDKHFPGMGPNNQYVVGGTNAGFQVIDATLVMNTARTDAQLIASPPNTSAATVGAVGPVVHSLGVPPMFAFAFPLQNSVAGVSFNFITADNSAVYFAPFNASNASGAVRTRIVVLR